MSLSNARPPWAYLADDVLQQIFLWSIIDSDEDIGCFDVDKSSLRQLPQLSISHVCSTWRRVALLTPRLWNRVSISCLFDTRTAKAKEWLSRAQNILVSIDVVMFDNDDFDMYWSSVLLFLSPYRIQDLYIHFDQDLPPLNLSARNVAELEMLTIIYNNGSIELNISQYPKLLQLEVSSHCKLFGTCGSLLQLDIPNSFLSVHVFWDILDGCPLLEEFTVSFGHWHDHGKSSVVVKNLYLPHLRILRITSWAEGTEFAFVINSLTLPHLETFHSNHFAAVSDWSAPAFGALVKRSNGLPHLTSLYLDWLSVTVDAGAIISLIPSVTKLTLCTSSIRHRVIFDTDTLTRLAIGSLGPQLKELIINSHISNPYEFMNMVESRIENAENCDDGTLVGFTRVSLAIMGCDEEGLLSHLSKLQQRGIPIDNFPML